MNITVNGQDVAIDAKSDAFMVADLLEHFEINFNVVVQKNGDRAEKWEEIVEGDFIQIVRFAGGG